MSHCNLDNSDSDKCCSSDLLTTYPELLASSRRRHFKKGQALFEQGATPEYLFAVHSGVFKVTRSSGVGRDVITELLFPGDVCGALCSLDCQPYPVQATCLVDAEVSAIPRDSFLAVVEEKPQALAATTSICRGKMRYQREMMVGMAVERAEQRAARGLLMLAERLGETTPDGSVRMPLILDRQEFSELIGTTVETAIRVMSRFRKLGWTEESKGTITLKAMQELKETAGL